MSIKKRVAIAIGIITVVSGVTLTTASNGEKVYLPNHKFTPGAINTNVTQANIQSTICVSNWTATIRPPASYTDKLKKEQLGNEYKAYVAMSGTADLGAYEEDHLISLELGGNPTDPRNLWAQPYTGTYGARAKDRVENSLHQLVCSNQISLFDAQTAISTNWYAAYQKYVKP
jgi:hypothetical protein